MAEIEERASWLMREWVKLQFGVFEEEGFTGDTIYPDILTEGRSNISNIGCSNKIQVKIQHFCVWNPIFKKCKI